MMFQIKCFTYIQNISNCVYDIAPFNTQIRYYFGYHPINEHVENPPFQRIFLEATQWLSASMLIYPRVHHAVTVIAIHTWIHDTHHIIVTCTFFRYYDIDIYDII